MSKLASARSRRPCDPHHLQRQCVTAHADGMRRGAQLRPVSSLACRTRASRRSEWLKRRAQARETFRVSSILSPSFTRWLPAFPAAAMTCAALLLKNRGRDGQDRGCETLLRSHRTRVCNGLICQSPARPCGPRTGPTRASPHLLFPFPS